MSQSRTSGNSWKERKKSERQDKPFRVVDPSGKPVSYHQTEAQAKAKITRMMVKDPANQSLKIEMWKGD